MYDLNLNPTHAFKIEFKKIPVERFQNETVLFTVVGSLIRCLCRQAWVIHSLHNSAVAAKNLSGRKHVDFKCCFFSIFA